MALYYSNRKYYLPHTIFLSVNRADSRYNFIWPASFGTSIAAAGYNEVTPTNDGFTITLPDATLASKGVDVIFSNVSIYEYLL